MPRPPVPVGNLKITDANGRLVLDLDPSGAQPRRGSVGLDGGPVRRSSLGKQAAVTMAG